MKTEKQIIQLMIEKALQKYSIDSDVIPSTMTSAEIATNVIMRYKDTKQRLFNYKQEISNLKKKFIKEQEECEHKLFEVQESCLHESTTYYPNYSHASKGYTALEWLYNKCDICEKEL